MADDDSRKEQLADDDSWKEQLAFVSGYILVFGFAALKLWPLAAGFQTGMNVNFWTMNLPSQGVTTALWVFWDLTAALAMALTAIALAIGHIMSRGLWLAFFSRTSMNPLVAGVSDLLDQLRRITYDGAFCLLPLVGFWVLVSVMVMLSAGLEGVLVSSLPLSLKAAGWIARSLAVVALFALGSPVWSKLARYIRAQDESQIPGLRTVTFTATGVFFGFAFMWFLVIQTCYKAEMNVAGRVFQPAVAT